jgi:hypothetical protein
MVRSTVSFLLRGKIEVRPEMEEQDGKIIKPC